MLERGSHVFVDTNVILEAHRARCWPGLVGYYRLDTVWKCVEECATGNRSAQAVQVDIEAIRAQLLPKTVTVPMTAALRLRLTAPIDLDPGEAELLAYVVGEPDTWLLCSPDRGAIRAAKLLGILDRVVAMEDMLATAGIHAELRRHFLSAWLADFRTRLALEDV
jgi:hypothetical protein